MADPLADELEGPFHPEHWGALASCGNCERYEGCSMTCLYHDVQITPDMSACRSFIPEVSDG